MKKETRIGMALSLIVGAYLGALCGDVVAPVILAGTGWCLLLGVK